MQSKKGIILIVSLWILSILSILAIGIGFRVSVEARLNKYNMDRLKGMYLAKAAIYKSQAVLSKDSSGYDSMRECGITLPVDKKLEEVFVENLGDGAFTVSYTEEGVIHYGMADEERKININTASPLVLQNIFNSEDMAASIVNWRSPKGAVQMLEGAKDQDYKSLTPPYECKHSSFSCIEELMMLLADNKAITPESFESVKDYITVYGNSEGKVNVNTATKRVMLALGLSDGVADIIIRTRLGDDKEAGTEDDGIFTGDIAAQLGLSVDSPDRTVLGNNFTIASNYFRIEAMGMVARSKINSRITCVIDKGAKKLVYYREY